MPTPPSPSRSPPPPCQRGGDERNNGQKKGLSATLPRKVLVEIFFVTTTLPDGAQNFCPSQHPLWVPKNTKKGSDRFLVTFCHFFKFCKISSSVSSSPPSVCLRRLDGSMCNIIRTGVLTEYFLVTLKRIRQIYLQKLIYGIKETVLAFV